MEQQILVPLDGSALAETIIPSAVAMARATSSALLLLRVVTPADAGPLLPPQVVLHTDGEEAVLTCAGDELAEIARRLRAEGLTVRTKVLSEQDVASAIVSCARDDPTTALIAMATHGRGGLSRVVFGSVAEAVLRSAQVPLLLVRAQENAAPRARIRAYRTIVVPLDSSAFAEQALDVARPIAAAARATLVLVAVVPQLDDIGLAEAGVVPFWMLADRQNETFQVADYLKRVARQIKNEGFIVRTRLVSGPPAEDISRVSAEEGADLIVMATHARSGLQRFWLGSIAAEVVQAVDLPVLLIRPDEQLKPLPRMLRGRREHAPV